MASRLKSDRKVCVTCEYWSGERTPCDQNRIWVKFDMAQKANCMVNSNWRTNSIRPACPKYQKLGWMK